jgi:CSLREA domain-containing protein
MSRQLARGLGARLRWFVVVVCALAILPVAVADEVALRVNRAEGSKLQLKDGYALSGSHLKRAVNRQALSLASGDVDGDGFPDLLSGYSTDRGGVITLHRGNKEAWAPSTPESFALLQSGSFPQGFESASTEWPVPIAPDFMVSGDFNGDGRADIVIAQRGQPIAYFLAGRKDGFAPIVPIDLRSGADALAAGQLDSRDGRPKLVVAVSGGDGPRLLTFASESWNAPVTQALAAPAEALAIGKLSRDSTGDVVVLGGGRVHVLYGDSVTASIRSAKRFESIPTAFNVRAFTLGDFIWDRGGATKIALLSDDGKLHVAARGELDTRPFTVEESRAMRLAQRSSTGAEQKRVASSEAQPWRFYESAANRASPLAVGSTPKLLRARLTNQAADDILFVDSMSQTIDVFTDEGSGRKHASVNASQMPVAALSIQTSAFVLPSLIVLGEGAAAPSVAPSVPQAVFATSKTADTNDGACNSDCSLREAISAANAAGGANSVLVGTGVYTLTIPNTGGNNEDSNAQGDLDITSSLSLIGIGASPRIIQAGTTTANGIDKVIAVNPLCTTAVNVSISDLTIRFGRNTQTFGASDFSYTGGGIDICGTGAQNFTMTNVVVDQNTNTTAYGGGINIDTVQPATGTYSIINSTISGNRTTSTASVTRNGGGINLFGDAHNVNITNSTITGNTSAFNGGGIFALHSFGGAITISGTTISDNNALSRGGGVAHESVLGASMTINNDSSIVNNVSQGTAVSTESRGGGILVNTGAAITTTINEVTITGNQASTGLFQGGGGIATMAGIVNATFNRVAGNSAGTGGGSGILNSGATVTATNNWWGCNAGSGSAPCDRSSSTSGSLNVLPYLTMRRIASPTTIVVGQTSTLTVDFLQNSAPATVALGDLDAMIGTPIAFNLPVRGTISAAQATIQSNGTATATFTATSVGAGSITSVVDAQSIAAAITINQASTTTTITSDLPDPSDLNAAVTVNYTVAANAPGSGTPTGNVVVTASGGSETCTGTVAAGGCVITLTTVGARTLTAAYAGDANYTASSGTTSHTVNPLPTLSINDVSIAEGNAGTQTLNFTVTRTGASASSVTFNYATADGTATAASGDYVAASGVGTIAGGGTSASTTISVTINGDTVFEGNETFFVNISSPVNATISDSQGVGTITNDDPAPPQEAVSIKFAGTGTGSTTSATAGLSCAANCATTVANGTSVTVTPVTGGGSVFTGWLGACTGTGNCAVTVTGTTELIATFAPAGTVATLDIDASNPATKYDAATDGVMVLRAMFGITGTAISTGTGSRSAADIATYLINIYPKLDANGDGKVQPLIDGLLVVRYLLGLRGSALIAGVPLTPLRPNAIDIELYLAGLTP